MENLIKGILKIARFHCHLPNTLRLFHLKVVKKHKNNEFLHIQDMLTSLHNDFLC